MDITEANIVLYKRGLFIICMICALIFWVWNKFKMPKRIHLEEKHNSFNSKIIPDDMYSPALPEVNHVSYIGARVTLPGGAKQFYKMINNRRSVRSFRNHPKPSIDAIENCIRAAGTAPSGAHTEPWTFCLIQDVNIKAQIRDIIETEEHINYTQRMHKQWTSDLRPLKTNHVKPYLTDAPYLILVFKQVHGFTTQGKRKQHYYNEISVSIAVGILLSALQADGISSLVTTPLHCGSALRNLLSRPTNEKLLVLLPIGYPDDECTVPDFQPWRERWSDSQWGINIKNVLPRGVSGDVYNLADCLLLQALIGSTANRLFLNYLKHSLCSHLVSHAAVIRRIAKYEHIERLHCTLALLDLLNSFIDGVTCRTKSEEAILPNAMVLIVNWLVQICSMILTHYEINGNLNTEQSYMLEQCCSIINKIQKNQYLLAVLYVGRYEDPDSLNNIQEQYMIIKKSLTNSNFTPAYVSMEKHIKQLAYLDIQHLQMNCLNVHPRPQQPSQSQQQTAEPITYCIQPLLTVDVLLNPCTDVSYYVAKLQMVQRLKKFSNTRLFYEIIRAGFISLSNVLETSHDAMWGAFTFFKVPQIIKQLQTLNRVPNDQSSSDYILEVVEAFEMLLEDKLLLDSMDSKCSCNIIELLLNDWTKQHLINERYVKHFASQRENTSLFLQKQNALTQAPSIINFIIRAEVPLSGVLKTLSTEYNKVQEALLGVLCQVLVGNSFELILSVATVEGRLKTFVSRLIQCNENSRQVPGEMLKSSLIRSTLFDVSFLMLTFIVQTYGADVVLSESNGDSFFERWVRNYMVERYKPKNPRQIILMCDEKIVDELLECLKTPKVQLKNGNIMWQDICMNLPGVLYHLLHAWEKEIISSTDVKTILDNIKRQLFSFSVCATSFLCNYLYSVKETELLKPLNMIQQFLVPPPTGEELSTTQENFKERHNLAFQIIRKMQQDVHPTINPKGRNHTLTTLQQPLVSQASLIDQFRNVWQMIIENGWLPIRAAQILESLLQSGGPVWLTTRLVEEMLKCKYVHDMMKIMDIVFSTLHLDIERCTEALLMQVVPSIMNNLSGEDIDEPYLHVLARLCVYCIISAVETRHYRQFDNYNSTKKRLRSDDNDDVEHGNISSAKLRKLNNATTTMATTGSAAASVSVGPTVSATDNNPCSVDNNSCSTNDYINDTTLSFTSQQQHRQPYHQQQQQHMHDNVPIKLKESLELSIRHIFRVFQQLIQSEELSLRIYFVYQFLTLLVECGQERIRLVLNLLPTNLISNLLKVMLTNQIHVGLIVRLNDVRSAQGRQAAINDLSLWRNLQLRQQSIQL